MSRKDSQVLDRGPRHADRLTAAIDEAFAPLVQLRADRLEHVGDGWSPSQHARRAS